MRVLRWSAVVLGMATIVELSLILALCNGRGPTWLFEQAASFVDAAMLPSSVLLGYLLGNRHRRTIGWLFWANAVAVLAALGGILMTGREPGLRTLFVCDVVWLNLYVLAFGRYWELLTAGAKE